MDYLRTNATASAVALHVIARHLLGHPGGVGEDVLRGSLQALSSDEESSAVLTASLAVGESLGIVTWTPDAKVRSLSQELARDMPRNDSWPWFRAELARRVGAGADEAEPSDLVRGIAWFLQTSPIEPLGRDWDGGAESLRRAGDFDAIVNSSQWRPFVRWAIALGIAHRAEAGSSRVVVPDASVAISDQLTALPAEARAREWIGALLVRLPFLGSPALIERLPPRPGAGDLLPGVEFGLRKLERAGRVVLEATDDASDVLTLVLGDTPRQVGRIRQVAA